MTAMNPSQGSQMDVEARFAHLLNPIRDLAKNWNIDLTSNLEEYLADLGNVELVFDNGKTTMNFAQAALLIQGSASVYSKKVEYLYNLAFEILKLFSNKKAMQNNADKQNNADCSTSQLESNPINEFLALDDIEVDNNLDKKSDDHKNKRLSFKYLSKTPTVLTPSEVAIKGDVMLYNRCGDLIGNKNDFQINLSKIHSSGLLVIDTNIAAETIDMKCPSFDIKSGKLNLSLASCQQPEDSLHCDDLDDVFDSCPSPAMSDCNFQAPIMKTPSPLKDKENLINEPPSMLRRSLRVKSSLEKKALAETLPIKEPLKLLDPYEETKSLVKPIKKLRRCILPESLEKESEKPKKKKSRLDEKIETVSEFCSLQFEKKGRSKCKTFKEFENQFWQEMDKRKEVIAKKNARKLAREKKTNEEKIDSDKEDDDQNENEDDDMPFDDDCGDNDPGSDVENVFDNISDEAPVNPLNPDRFDFIKDTTGGPIIQSYEDLVREHVDKYMMSAGNYAQLSDLGKRVKEWEEKIKPRLDAEEHHESYDIHVYGSRILGQFKEQNSEKTQTFEKICHSKPKFEICRLFLASLQLANNYNVEITTDGPLESGVDSMTLTVLSSNRHHEELQDYRAPSIK